MYENDRIRLAIARMGFIGRFQERHIAAYMLLEHDDIDKIPEAEFLDEMRIAITLIQTDGIRTADRLAETFNL